jgi:hypothetical protein
MNPDDVLHVSVVACDEPFDTAGDYVRRFWLSQLGPTSTMLLQLLADEGSRAWRVYDLAVRLGVGRKAQNHANNPLGRSLERLEKFRLIERADDRVYVRSHLPRLDGHHLSRVTDELRSEHAAWLAAHEAVSPLSEAR